MIKLFVRKRQCIEALSFYLIFPFVAKLFKKKPVITYFVMVAMSWMFDNWGIINQVSPNNYSMWINKCKVFDLKCVREEKIK